MAILTVSKFSCIQDATFELAPVNIIIGPQGSGKSVTTKLFYFFSDITTEFFLSAERGIDFDDYRRQVARQFAMWFPPPAWGAERFVINYTAGPFSVRLLRRRTQGRPADEVSVTFSEWFAGTYRKSLELLGRSAGTDEMDLLGELKGSHPMEKFWRVRETLERLLATDMGDDYFARQTFIPAGRAFFTSIGRLVAGLEQAGSLDPVTIRFARLFANVRDRAARRILHRSTRLSPDFLERRKQFMVELFGGELRYENDLEYVKTVDGRKVPFSSLSSGQQELLPMWSLIDYFSEIDALTPSALSGQKRPREIVYIEEPEAHLFPSAQSLLMRFLIGSVSSERNYRHLILTTHSPYIMGQLNVFLKAGQLARRKKNNREILEIVPRECWLNDKKIAAFSIQNSHLRSIIDADGLIDATYLDGISEEISRQFSNLLKIEMEMQ